MKEALNNNNVNKKSIKTFGLKALPKGRLRIRSICNALSNINSNTVERNKIIFPSLCLIIIFYL